jgi:NAD(P)-dependent dehydrogenase (short-subunit alcohol dehydrogenase family)
MPNHSINGKVVLIAGGAKNLGGLIARDLAGHGAKAVVVHYNSPSSEADAHATVAAIEALGAKAVALQADLTTAGAVEKLFNDAVGGGTTGYCDQHGRQGVEEADGRDHRGGVRRDDGGQRQDRFLFIKEAGKHLNDNGKICTIVTSLLGAFTPFYAAYAGSKAPVEQFTGGGKRAGTSWHFGDCSGARPNGHALFYPAEGEDAVNYHKSAAALSPFSRTGLTDIEDVVPFIRNLVGEGWWVTGQTILINGGYTTK